jgi:nitrous oxidase accessory protein
MSTIKSALNLAEPGDTLFIESGIYQEGPLLIEKSIHLIGRGTPQLDGMEQHTVITVRADDVVVEGLVIKNAGVSFIEDHAGIHLDKVSNCRISDNQFEDNFFAIYLSEASDCIISNNIIHSRRKRETRSGNGIHLWYCKNIAIHNNQISGHRDGIYFEFVENGDVKDNLSENNLRYGLHFMFSDHCQYINNIFRKNGAGVAVMYTRNIRMQSNRFEQNRGPAAYGLLLKDIKDSYIFGNTFIENSLALYSEASDRLTIEYNDFISNGWAIKLMANSMDNMYRHNNFINNAFDVATNSRQNFNRFDQNYWSTYRGYDLDKNGIGDEPFRPVRLFSFIIQERTEALILLNGLFVELLDIAERALPVFTPPTLIDQNPLMQRVQ